ncbi:TPA: hypothetical protein GXZ34_00695 [bacterium]|nr:hypothetical protein [bacterium]
MAIIKKLKSGVGIDVSYHRVVHININYQEKQVNIGLASYIDLSKRIDNYRPLEVVDIEVPKEDFNIFKHNNLLKAAYEWLKVNVEGFDKSKDDLENREVKTDE